MLPRLLLSFVAVVMTATGLSAPASASSTVSVVSMKKWTSNADFTSGKTSKVTVSQGALRLAGKSTRGTWTSPWIASRGARSLIPSWNVPKLAKGSSLRIRMRARNGNTVTGWKTMADWRHALAGGKRRSFGAQSDKLVRVQTDTLQARRGASWTGWQIRVRMDRTSSSIKTPVVTSVHVSAASSPSRSQKVSRTSMTEIVDLPVPAYSQMIHRGTYRQYGGGGEAWCSPTSVAMVLKFHGRGPKAKELTWAKGPDPHVIHAARFTYDSAYRGTGNWSFNTAYASRYGTTSFVRRFKDLRAVEKQIKAGRPVIASIAFGRGQLTGSPLTLTPGHLVVIRGFTADGRVIVNDPAGRDAASVKRIYNRAQFEKAWLGGSGGVGYLIIPSNEIVK